MNKLYGQITGTVTDAANGTAIAGATVSDGTRVAISNATGFYSISNVPAGNYTVTATASGYNSASQTVMVATGASITANFALSVIPVTPVINTIGNQTATEGSPLQFTVTASDPDGDPLTYSASNLPSGASFNNSTHVFSWTPAMGQAGIYSGVTFSVSDGLATTSQVITITVNKLIVYGEITGMVTDAANGTAITGAIISDGTQSVTSNASGAYAILNVPDGNYTVTANASGYVLASQTVTVASNVTANFKLTKVVAASTMWVNSITFTSSGSYFTAYVKVANPQPVAGAKVSINVSYNGRHRSTYSATTNTSGQAVFRINARNRGTYTVSVTQLSYPGYTWDTTRGVTSAIFTK